MRYVLLLLAAPASAQQSPSAPAADPLLAEQTRAQAVAQMRAQMAARARFQADLATSPTPAPADPGRARPVGDQPDAVANRTPPSPYGGYYRIRTPWDRR